MQVHLEIVAKTGSLGKVLKLYLSVSFHVLSISTPSSTTEVMLRLILATDSVVNYHTSIRVYEKYNKKKVWNLNEKKTLDFNITYYY